MQPLISHLSTSSGQLFPGTPAVAKGKIVGTAFNGTTQQATVQAYAISNGATGAQLASTATDAQGNFILPIGSYTGPVMLQMVGATYTDVATGRMMTLGASDTLTMVMPTVASGATTSGVWVTPLTAMAQARAQAMGGGMIEVNIMAANTAVGNYFMAPDILHTQPMNPSAPGSAAMATQDMKNYGAVIGAMSQFAKGLTMPTAYSFVTAMMNDAADGMMDGKANGSPIACVDGHHDGPDDDAAECRHKWLSNGDVQLHGVQRELSGATAGDVAAALIQKLNSSSGQLQ
ncbi:MAG: hypothetical protein IPG25_19535 [Proteobacteria bacterium]|nr:hypothetical protein [Pseudomonadota bacterium]